MSSTKQYYNNTKPGETSIESREGAKIIMNKNIIIASKLSTEFIEELRKNNFQGNVDSSADENSSFAYFGNGPQNINNQGNTNQNTLGLNTSVDSSEVISPVVNEAPTNILPVVEPFPSPPPTPTPTPSSIPVEEGGEIFDEDLPLIESISVPQEYPNDDKINAEVVKGIEEGKIEVVPITNASTTTSSAKNKSPITKASTTASSAKNKSPITKALFSFIFIAGYSHLGNPRQDYNNDIINMLLINDIAEAAASVDIIVTITTAKTGHDQFVNERLKIESRHWTGEGVDIAILNGIGSGKATNSTNGDPKFRELGNKLKDAFVSLGYVWNIESGNPKAVIWQTKDHYNHLHVSRRR